MEKVYIAGEDEYISRDILVFPGNNAWNVAQKEAQEMRLGILRSPRTWGWIIGGALLLSPVLVLAAPSCDERDCTRGGGSTAATSQPVQPTAAPATVPTEAPESIQVEPIPTDVDWINRIRTSNRTIIVRDPVIWAPTGAMTWDITVNLESELSDWFSRHGDPNYPNYGLAAQDWSTIEGHKQWLINLANSAQPQQNDEATAQPEATVQPTSPPVQGASPVPNQPSAEDCSRYRMLLQAAITNKAQIEAALPDLEAKVAAARRNANEAQKALSEAIAQRGLKQTAMNKKITERSYYPSKINEATRAQNWQKVAELNQELTKLQAEIDQLAAEIAQINQTIPGLNQNAQNMEALLFAANTNLSRARSELLVAKADIEKYKPLVAQCNGGQVSAA